MFKKNLDALKECNKALAEELENLSLDIAKENIDVYQAESKDIIISYSGLALDDIYDPIREAKTNWNLNVKNKPSKYDIIFIFGLGLGYLFKRAYVNCESRIVLYEPKLEILRYVLEYVDFSEQIADKRVFISTNRNEVRNYLTEKYLSDDQLMFLFPKAYAQLLTNELTEITNDIVEVCNLKKMDVTTIKRLAKNWANHSLKNLTNIYKTRPLSWLKNKYEGKVALITAAGPSLAENIQTIKNNRDKFIIFAVNRSAEILLNNNINPDFVVFSDVVPIDDTVQGILHQLKNTNIVADLRANSFVYENFDNLFTYFSKNDVIAQSISNLTNNSFDLMETAGTTTAQCYFAAKILGIENIIFAGLDLAFKDNTIYADGKKVTMNEDNTVYSGSEKRAMIKVKDLNGNDILTRDDYALFIRQFEDIFATDTTSKIYNISSFGAYIKGMNYVKLDDILNDFNPLEFDISSDLTNFRAASQDKWNNIVNQIEAFLKQEITTLNDILHKTTLLLNDEVNVLKKLNEDNDNTELRDRLTDLTKEFSNFIPEIVADSFLSQYFQSEFLGFVNICDPNNYQSIEAFVNLKNFEINMLNAIISIANDWVKFLKEKYE